MRATSKLASYWRLAVLFLSVALAGCGGGGGGGDTPAPTPTPTPTTVPSGTWFGQMEDPVSVMKTLSVTTSGTSITQILVNGVSTGQTGTMTHRSGNIFAFALSDGVQGGFFLDSAQTHAVFLDDDFNIGVVQRGATTLPAFSHTDLNGSWSGVAVTVPTIAFATFTAVTSTASCTVPTCTVTDSGGTTTGTFSSANFTSTFSGTGTGTQWGRWPGTYTSNSSPIAPSGSMRVFLSVDKQFAGAWACTTATFTFPGTFPGTCKFFAWAK